MIDVLLATYQPNAEWLKAQIDSIRAQEDVGVNLIRREDECGAGACANFSVLLGQSQADYAAFADQDDVWFSGKLAKSLAKMRALEAECGKDTPILVFTDGIVTDAELNQLPGTAISRQRVDIRNGLTLNRLLMQNFIPGNAMLFNAALRERAGSIPADALMHDCWLALVASAFGRIGFVDEPLYFYRQHGRNAIGETAGSLRHVATRTAEGSGAFRARLGANVWQARAFVERFGADAPPAARALARFPEMTVFERRRAIVRHGLHKQGVLRNIALFLFA